MEAGGMVFASVAGSDEQLRLCFSTSAIVPEQQLIRLASSRK